MKSIVVAYDKNYGIGAAGDMLWKRDLPADLEHFKKLTIGKSVIMGRKTFESIGRPLPGRQNIVVTAELTEIHGVMTAASLEDAYDMALGEIFVIGGGQIYKQALYDIDRIFATEIDATFSEAEIYFPAIDMDIWAETSRQHNNVDESNKYPFDFVVYERIDGAIGVVK